MKTRLLMLAAVLLFPVFTFAQGSYKQPPKEIMDVLNAPATPSTSISPTREKLAMLEPLRYPPISEPRTFCLRPHSWAKARTE